MEQEIKSTGHKSLVGFYIDDSIQWVSGNEYLRYCQHFDNVFRKLFPYNCTQLYWKNILIVGGGDMQLKSGTYMLSTDCRTKIIDPNIHKYQKILVESKDKVPEFIFNKQRDCYNNPRFTDYLTYTIQEFLEEEKYINETFDLIVVDLVDGLATDEDNIYMSRLWDRLRDGGVMIGYGGTSMKDFVENCSLLLFDNSNIVLEERHYPSWATEDSPTDKGIVYGITKK